MRAPNALAVIVWQYHHMTPGEMLAGYRRALAPVERPTAITGGEHAHRGEGVGALFTLTDVYPRIGRRGRELTHAVRQARRIGEPIAPPIRRGGVGAAL